MQVSSISRVLGALLTVSLVAGLAHAEEPTDARVPLVEASTSEAISTLDPKTRGVALRYSKGDLGRLVVRCPDLERLEIRQGSTLPLEDFAKITKFAKLRDLSIRGDMAFPLSHFEIVGSLTGLKRLDLALH